MKTSSQFNLGRGVRGRDADFPRKPKRVTDVAQAKLIDINTSRKFDFSQQHRGNLPERPSTSGGLVNSSRRRDVEKRETKDDLHFNPLAAHGKGTTFYNFPLPGSLPTPDQTPRSSPPPPRKSSLAKPRSYTPESIEPMPTNMPVQTMDQIGMALGSPSHQPADWQTQNRFETMTRSPSPDVMDDSSFGGLVAPPKPKASKWKILGGIFGGRKHSACQTTPFYQLQPEPAQMTVTPGVDFVGFGEPTTSEVRPKFRGRGRTLSERKTKKNKPDLKRAETAPLQFDFEENGQQRTATPEITLEGSPLMENTHSNHEGKPYNGQMLDVDIPSIQLERYSVMFGSVLQKPTSTASSLLARRQATLDKLKTVNEALVSKEQELQTRERLLRPRRATSPQPTKSPAFSLFPNTPSRLTVREPSPAGSRKSPLQRSNTSPAALSPSRPTFAPGPDNDAHAMLISPPTNLIGPSHPQYNGPSIGGKIQKKQEPKPSTSAPKTQVTRDWSGDHSQLILDSPISDVEEEDEEAETEDIYDTSPLPMRTSDATIVPMKPKLVEPSWQMVVTHAAPSTTSSSVSASTMRSDHSTSTSSTSTSSVSAASAPYSGYSDHKTIIISSPPPPKTRQRSATTTAARQRRNPSEVSNESIASSNFSTTASVAHEEDENEARLKTAADVSIARQISLSHQQKQLLIPIKSKTPSNTSLNKQYNQNFPSPRSDSLGVNRVASPLGAVVTAVTEERDREVKGKNRTGSPLVDRKDRGEKIERLVQGIKPNTPTLVVVPGPDKNETVKAWGGATTVHGAPVGLAERRRGSGNAMGEIKVGLAVNVGKGATAHGHPQRKSERVIVERMSIVSN